MSAQHTPGRLTLSTTYAEHELRGEGGELIATSMPHRVVDARRLVACWNACDGVSTGNLEVLPGYKAAIEGFHKQRGLFLRAQAQRDALLTAAQWVINNPGAHPENVRLVMKDAIAKADGQEGGHQIPSQRDELLEALQVARGWMRSGECNCYQAADPDTFKAAEAQVDAAITQATSQEGAQQ